MNQLKIYEEALREIKGKVIAVVYIFEGEDAPGYKHYESWKGDLIGEWIQAVNELHCLPLIFDLRTFIQKAMDRSLPKIDFVVNLNNGTLDVSTLGVVPSVCSFLAIPCIPCNTIANVSGEHKLLSNLIAFAKKLNIPEELDRSNPTGITRPFGFGSSVGVVKGIDNSEYRDKDCLYQEFIPGFDMTTPILYNPLSDKLEVLPPVMYCQENDDVEWFLGEKEKSLHKGYSKMIAQIDDTTKERFLELAKSMQITTYCRIDCRVRCDTSQEINLIREGLIPFDRVFFLEINPTPTIKQNIKFHTSLHNLNENNPILQCYQHYRIFFSNASNTGFILSCAMLALSKAKYEI